LRVAQKKHLVVEVSRRGTYSSSRTSNDNGGYVMPNAAIFAIFTATLMGVNIYSAAPAMSRPGQIMTTRDMSIECHGNGWVGRGPAACCSGRCKVLKSKRCRCIGNKPSF
jgi:hypothetical protein